MIIGVIGYIGAGKGEFVDILKGEYKFVPVTFKEIILREAKRKRAILDRDSLQNIGRDLEKRGVLAQRVIGGIKARQRDNLSKIMFLNVSELDNKLNLLEKNLERIFI